MQARWPLDRGSERGGRRESLPIDRRGGAGADARRDRGSDQAQSLSLPSRFQGRDRRDAQGLCRRGAGGPSAGAARQQRDSDGSDLRRGVQLQRTFLRDFDRPSRNDAEPLPRRRRQRGVAVRRRPMLAGRHSGRLQRQGRGGDPDRRRSRRFGAGPAGPFSSRPPGRRRCALTKSWWRRSSAS